jgi:hypothetical protein
MSVQTDESSKTHVGNNSTVTPYQIPFFFFEDTDLVVVRKDIDLTEHTLILNTDFTVTGAGNENGGSLKTIAPVAVTSTLTVLRDVPATQLTRYVEGDAFPAQSHERALDKLTMLCQQNARVTGGGDPTALAQAFRLSDASGGINALTKINDTMVGIDAAGKAILRTPSDLLGWLGQVGTVWADTPARLGTRGAFAGQLGVQLDNRTVYIALSTTSGDWTPFLVGTGIVFTTNGTPHAVTPPAGDLVGTDASQVLYNKTLISPSIQTPTGLTKSDVGLGQVDNTSDLNKPLSSATGAALAFKQDKAEKGVSDGYASLDSSGKVPAAQLPSGGGGGGGSVYQGTWNAATNTPTIPAAAPANNGWFYVVNVAGTTNVSGITSWAVGDQLWSNGTVWQKIPNVNAVQSVNTKTGVVVLVKGDIGLANVDNTSDATKNSAVATLTNKTIDGASNTVNVRLATNDVSGNLPVARLNGGTGAGPGTFWCGDNSWKAPSGFGGDVVGPNGATDGEVALYSGTTGKIIRRYSGPAGVGKFSATGVFSAAPVMAADLSPNVISGLPVATDIAEGDQLMVLEQASGVLKSVAGNRANRLPPNHLSGLAIGNNTADTANDIDIYPGCCRDDTDAADIVIPIPSGGDTQTVALTKRLDAAWAAGNNQGGRDTGAIADQSYHVFVIRNPTTKVVDALFSHSLFTPTLPSGFTQFRRIGSINRRGAGGIIPFTQRGDDFEIKSPINDVSGITLPANTTGFFDMINLPDGRPWLGRFIMQMNHATAGAYVLLKNPLAPGSWTLGYPLANTSTYFSIWTSNGGGIEIKSGPAAGTYTFYLSTTGWTDTRGRDGYYGWF